jgi:drug/metabolite transporter (DMT)-like permease
MSLAITVLPALLFWTPPTAFQWFLLAGVGGLGVASQAMIIRAYRSGEASFVAPFDYLKLILAGLIGFFVFGEVPGPWTLLGAVVIVAAALYIARREAARAVTRRQADGKAPVAPLG